MSIERTRLLPVDDVFINRLKLPRLPLRLHQTDLGVIALQLVDHHSPFAEVADVFVGRWSIDELQHGWCATVENRKQQSEAEGIRVLSDRMPKIERDLLPDLSQRPLLSILRGPDRRVDVGCVGTLRIVEVFRQPTLTRCVFSRDDTSDHWNRQFLQQRKVV